MDRVMTVTGNAKIYVKPDLMVLDLSISDWKKDCDEIFIEAKRQTEIIRDVVCRCGFNRDDLKTVIFTFDDKEELYKDRYGDSEYRFIGYEFTHRMKLEFDIDNKVLESLLSEISDLDFMPEISLGYAVKDVDLVKNKLLEKCVEDSTKKANILASASNIKLGKILSIDYSWKEIEILPRYRDVHILGETHFDIDQVSFALEPENVDLNDSVTIRWEII